MLEDLPHDVVVTTIDITKVRSAFFFQRNASTNTGDDSDDAASGISSAAAAGSSATTPFNGSGFATYARSATGARSYVLLRNHGDDQLANKDDRQHHLIKLANQALLAPGIKGMEWAAAAAAALARTVPAVEATVGNVQQQIWDLARARQTVDLCLKDLSVQKKEDVVMTGHRLHQEAWVAPMEVDVGSFKLVDVARATSAAPGFLPRAYV